MTHFVVSCDAHPFDWCAPMARVKTALQHVFVILIEVHLDAEHAVRCGVDCRRAIKILPPRGVRKVFNVLPSVSACGFAKCYEQILARAQTLPTYPVAAGEVTEVCEEAVMNFCGYGTVQGVDERAEGVVPEYAGDD